MVWLVSDYDPHKAYKLEINEAICPSLVSVSVLPCFVHCNAPVNAMKSLDDVHMLS